MRRARCVTVVYGFFFLSLLATVMQMYHEPVLKTRIVERQVTATAAKNINQDANQAYVTQPDEGQKVISADKRETDEESDAEIRPDDPDVGGQASISAEKHETDEKSDGTVADVAMIRPDDPDDFISDQPSTLLLEADISKSSLTESSDIAVNSSSENQHDGIENDASFNVVPESDLIGSNGSSLSTDLVRTPTSATPIKTGTTTLRVIQTTANIPADGSLPACPEVSPLLIGNSSKIMLTGIVVIRLRALTPI